MNEFEATPMEAAASQATEQRAVYQKPALTEIGSVSRLTLSKSGSPTDSTMPMMR